MRIVSLQGNENKKLKEIMNYENIDFTILKQASLSSKNIKSGRKCASPITCGTSALFLLISLVRVMCLLLVLLQQLTTTTITSTTDTSRGLIIMKVQNLFSYRSCSSYAYLST